MYEFESFYYFQLQSNSDISGNIEIFFKGFNINLPSDLQFFRLPPLTSWSGVSQDVRVWTNKIEIVNAKLNATVFGGGFIPKIS